MGPGRGRGRALVLVLAQVLGLVVARVGDRSDCSIPPEAPEGRGPAEPGVLSTVPDHKREARTVWLTDNRAATDSEIAARVGL